MIIAVSLFCADSIKLYFRDDKVSEASGVWLVFFAMLPTSIYIFQSWFIFKQSLSVVLSTSLDECYKLEKIKFFIKLFCKYFYIQTVEKTSANSILEKFASYILWTTTMKRKQIYKERILTWDHKIGWFFLYTVFRCPKTIMEKGQDPALGHRWKKSILNYRYKF